MPTDGTRGRLAEQGRTSPRRPVIVTAAAVLIAIALLPGAARAATCADYPDQASAQRAKDTRDADHDGVFCEDNPCPCLGSAGDGNAKTPSQHRPRLGGSRRLAPRRRTGGCRLRGARPDRGCTPGAVFRNASRRLVCRTGFSSQVRHVTDAMRDRVYAEYGIRSHAPGQYEIDHLVPLELGGSNAIANLFPQPARPKPPGPGFHEKDALENSLRAAVCGGSIGLRRARRAIARNWVAAYVRYVGD